MKNTPKKIFYLFWGTAFLLCSCKSPVKEKQQNDSRANTPAIEHDSTATAKMEIKETTFNFGDLTQGEIVAHTFHFKNTGKKSLVILKVGSSCGCTIPKYNDKPIPPGGEGKIEVEFNSSGRYGKQYKVINIFANTPQKVVELKIVANIKTQ